MNKSTIFTVFDAAAATATKAWGSGDHPVWELEIATSGFSGTVDIQTAFTETAGEFKNTRYVENASGASPTTAQLSYTADTSRKTYYVLAHAFARLVMTRTAGTITAKVRGLAVFPSTLLGSAGSFTADTELPAAVALNGTIAKSVSAPVVGAALLVSDNTNFIQPLGDAANGLDVDVTRLPASEIHLGKVGGTSPGVVITPTLTVAGAYASGDYVGPSTTPVSAASVVRTATGTGWLQSLVLVDKAAQSAALELWVFDRTFTAPADNAAWAVSDADALNCLGVVEILASDYKASGNNSIATVKSIGLWLQPNSGTTLHFALVSRGSPTYVSGDLQLRLGVLSD